MKVSLENKGELETTIDNILAQHRIPHRVFIFNIDSEIRSICFPNYRRREELLFNKGEQP